MDSQAQARRAVSVSEARALVMATLPGRRGVDAALTEAAGLLTVDSTLAREDMPRHDTAAMDGYAVRVTDLAEASGDRPARLRITGALLAGDTAGMSLERGHTVRIMTGARCPPGCEAVIPHEVAAVDGDTVSFAAPARLGANLRRAGEDVRAGNLLIPAGAPLHAARVALLAAQGIDQIRVFARPRVAIVTTGDELVGGGELRDGEIRDSNTSMLERLCLEIGAEIVETRRVGDSPDALDLALEEVLASRPDLIVTAGGASSGDRDVVTGLRRGGR
ncbi:MAG: molybdopterin molybdotransferase MoeA, partial [Chloroflexota bacterium]|nr:molybdopterin molybdotransferase MoeA [Chloroflexota bacterium]